jgi:hypothetical protein
LIRGLERGLAGEWALITGGPAAMSQAEETVAAMATLDCMVRAMELISGRLPGTVPSNAVGQSSPMPSFAVKG